MGTELESLHVRDEMTGDCACGAMWIPSGRDHPRSPATGPGKCWNEGTTQGDVWEVKQRLEQLIENFVKPMQVIVKEIGPLLKRERLRDL